MVQLVMPLSPARWLATLARRGVILVTINYRLGAFGFLASEEITAENGGAVGNVALLDQIGQVFLRVADFSKLS